MSEFEQIDRGLHEECGVFGIYDPTGGTDMVSAVYSALYALQHRGQESCGIALNVDGVLSGYRDLGLVSEVFTPRVLGDLPKGAKMASGHVRYATAGQRSRSNAQPMVLHHCKGAMALCHNGNLTNAPQLRHALEMSGSIFHGTSDTEVIAYLITHKRLISPDIQTALCRTMDELEGAYSLVIMSHTKLIAARDPHGFRPLCIGTLPGGGYAFASESCALDAVGAKFLRDVAPGEIVVANHRGLRSIRTHCGTAPHTMCVFEYVYFARPDSVIEGTCVHEARIQAGRFLAQEHPVDADVVIGVPDSGLDAAQGYALESGIPYGSGFIKNKYVGRTFIQGSQAQRESSVRIKLNVISSTVKGKRVVLIDDSIVRGTTSARIIGLLRDAGAKEVHFRVSAPPFAHPCYFGTDIPDEKLLVATGHTVEEINEILGADSLGYLSVEHVQQLAPASPCQFCVGCFTGRYPVAPPTETMDIVYDKPLSISNPNKIL
jgi:amidophosphoribosyltransferase